MRTCNRSNGHKEALKHRCCLQFGHMFTLQYLEQRPGLRHLCRQLFCSSLALTTTHILFLSVVRALLQRRCSACTATEQRGSYPRSDSKPPVPALTYGDPRSASWLHVSHHVRSSPSKRKDIWAFAACLSNVCHMRPSNLGLISGFSGLHHSYSTALATDQYLYRCFTMLQETAMSKDSLHP